jgi:hypothetical protein
MFAIELNQSMHRPLPQDPQSGTHLELHAQNGIGLLEGFTRRACLRQRCENIGITPLKALKKAGAFRKRLRQP